MKPENIQALIASNEAYRNIVERTSVRLYTDEPLTAEQLEALVYAGMSAPTGVNKQPWEFMVVTDRALLEGLAAGLPYAKMTAKAPAAIVVCGNRERFLEGDDATLWEQDLSAASENILLAAHALGLGGVWTCIYPHADRAEVARRVLNLPENLVPFNLIPVGHPAKAGHPMDKFHPERVHQDKL